MKNGNEITPLVITRGLDIFQAHDLIDTLGNHKGTEAAIYAIEDWAAENAVAFALKYANEGNADDAAALLEIYDGDGGDDDNWADVIGAIDRARTNEWASRDWLEIKTRTVPVTSEENLHEIERAAAISGLTVTDYGVDDDGHPTDATIMGTADDIKLLDQLADHFNAPANEEPANDADDDAPENKTDAYDAVWQYLGCPEGDFLKEILEEAAEDVRKDPTNLFKAGQFEGTARMLAAAIVNDGANKKESVATITRAVYDYCGIGW